MKHRWQPPPWNQCQDCGRFIAYKDFEASTAVSEIISPSSEFTDERHEVYHKTCSPVGRKAMERK